MGMKINLELSDADLEHFRKRLQKAREAAGQISEEAILKAAEDLLVDVREGDTPEFIKNLLEKISDMVNMVRDTAWALPEENRQRVLSALTYFSDPEDIIPDEIPGLGYLDDAIMVELLVRELKHEIQAYQDFCAFRANEANRRGLKLDEDMSRADWLKARRKQLHERIRNRRRRDKSRRKSRGRSAFSLW